MSAQVFNECKTRNNLNIVRQYLQYGTFPKDCKKVDRRAVRKRSKTFEVIDGQLYYTGGRPKRSINIQGDEETTKTPENESDHTQILRKCCCTDEEKHEAVMKCHIGDDGRSKLGYTGRALMCYLGRICGPPQNKCSP